MREDKSGSLVVWLSNCTGTLYLPDYLYLECMCQFELSEALWYVM